MAESRTEDWREIAQAIQNETDSEKLQQLVKKLCQALERETGAQSSGRDAERCLMKPSAGSSSSLHADSS
jgi:hypothetical protein